MAKLLRTAAFALCLLMVLPGFACAYNLDDIKDDVTAPPEVGAADAQDPADDASPTGTPAADVPSFNDLGAADSSGQALDITKNCKYKLSEGKAAPMVDNSLNTRWTSKKAKAKITITLPAGDLAGWLYLEWYKKPSDFSIVEVDEEDQEIATTKKEDSFSGLVNVFPLQAGTRKLTLNLPKKGTSISTLRVYSQGTLSSGVQDWQAPVSKADLMVVAVHQDDEFLYMGGTIPYYAGVRDKNVQVVYMANGGRARYKEALNGLWAVGLRSYPDFVGLSNKSTKKLSDAAKLWNRTRTLDILVERIRKYKPEVIVTHDVKGENGNGSNMLVAAVIQDAIVQAADETKFTKSAEKYGTWQAKKLYLHLYSDNQITMDWQTAYPELDGKTPADIARVGFAAHKSQQKKSKYEDGGKYDNALFGLAFTTVGQDTAKNDMFENIPEDGSAADPSLRLNPLDYTDETDLTGDEGDFNDDMPDDDDVNYTFDDSQDFDDVLDNTANGPEATPVAPPVESAPGGGNIALIGLLIGVPVVLTGSAFGVVYGRKYLRKRRRAERQARRNPDSAA